MTPEEVKASYRRNIGPFETIIIRVYTGTGAGRPHTDFSVSARVVDNQADDLVGNLVQGDRKVIVLYEDLVAATSFPFPIETGPNWKAVVRGKELQIKSINDNTRRLQGVLMAYDLVVGG